MSVRRSGTGDTTSETDDTGPEPDANGRPTPPAHRPTRHASQRTSQPGDPGGDREEADAARQPGPRQHKPPSQTRPGQATNGDATAPHDANRRPGPDTANRNRPDELKGGDPRKSVGGPDRQGVGRHGDVQWPGQSGERGTEDVWPGWWAAGRGTERRGCCRGDGGPGRGPGGQAGWALAIGLGVEDTSAFLNGRFLPYRGKA